MGPCSSSLWGPIGVQSGLERSCSLGGSNLNSAAVDSLGTWTNCAADGLTFLADSVVAEEITKDSEYKGTRILLNAHMNNVRLRIQIDFGVGDVIVPGPRLIEYPAFLGGDVIRLLAYPVETAIAEKIQAMVALGGPNSRMKDFFDVWICSRHLDFDGDILAKAVDATFQNRDTPVPTEEFEALTIKFPDEHRMQWNAFVRNVRQSSWRDESSQ
jgi:Nucleotidyl transferase AbiEii toxin, Type IV TA system